MYVVVIACRPNVGGLVSKEKKVDQEVLRGPQGTSFEELNPEQGKPRCICRTAPPCFIW
jgi:hypothetical protein